MQVGKYSARVQRHWWCNENWQPRGSASVTVALRGLKFSHFSQATQNETVDALSFEGDSTKGKIMLIMTSFPWFEHIVNENPQKNTKFRNAERVGHQE